MAFLWSRSRPDGSKKNPDARELFFLHRLPHCIAVSRLTIVIAATVSRLFAVRPAQMGSMEMIIDDRDSESFFRAKEDQVEGIRERGLG